MALWAALRCDYGSTKIINAALQDVLEGGIKDFSTILIRWIMVYYATFSLVADSMIYNDHFYWLPIGIPFNYGLNAP